VLQAVHRDFETIFLEIPSKCLRNAVSLGHKVKGRSKTPFSFKFYDVDAFLVTECRVHVMGQHKGKFLLIRPSGPSGGNFCRIHINRPEMPVQFEFSRYNGPSKKNLEISRDKWLDLVKNKILFRLFGPSIAENQHFSALDMPYLRSHH